MRTHSRSIAADLLALSVRSPAGQFGNQCAWGLAHRKHVHTGGNIRAHCSDGRTYCFSTEAAKESFLEDTSTNARKAGENFGIR